MPRAQPTKMYNGTVEEVFSHRDEIPPGSLLELRVFAPRQDDDEVGDFGGRSIADLIREIGFVEGLPSDLSTNPKYMAGFGETGNHRAD
jgi:hypothetical protein